MMMQVTRFVITLRRLPKAAALVVEATTAGPGERRGTSCGSHSNEGYPANGVCALENVLPTQYL